MSGEIVSWGQEAGLIFLFICRSSYHSALYIIYTSYVLVELLPISVFHHSKNYYEPVNSQ